MQLFVIPDPFWMTAGDSDAETESPFLFRFIIVLEPMIKPEAKSIDKKDAQTIWTFRL